MGKIKLPKKIKISSIFKLLMLSVFIFAGVYFYPNFKNINQPSEVLQAATGTSTPVYRINNYVMKDVIRPNCDKTQPYMDFFCLETKSSTSKLRYPTFGVTNTSQFKNYLASTTNYTTTVQNSGIEFYGNPVLEEIQGVPILAYYGGIYEVVLGGDKQSVVNLTRTFKTVGNVGYTSGCKSSWFPSNVGKKGSTLLFGSGGLEDLLENRCFDQVVKTKDGTVTGFGTTYRGDVECKQTADRLGIPLVPGCRLSNTSSCWDKNYQCQTLNGFTMYYNIPFISVLNFTKNAPDVNGSVLKLSKAVGMSKVLSSGGAATWDAYTFCRGKTKNDCSQVTAELKYGVETISCTDTTCNNYGTTDYSGWGMPPSANGIKKFFYKRVHSRYGYNPVWQESTDLNATYGGYDTPYSAYVLPNRVDALFIENGSNSTQYNKYRLNIVSKNGLGTLEYDPTPFDIYWASPNDPYDRIYQVIDVRYNVLSDFVSNNYYFSLQYQNNKLILSRFKVTGYLGSQKTLFSQISLSGVSLTYNKNVSFAIDSADNLDIMIAPNFNDSLNNINAKTRIFRAKKFNSAVGTYNLFELTPQNGGYSFETVGPGNNAPLTFRYYNNTDADTTNDYAVFASRNYVFSSKVAASRDCLLNNNLVVANTNPNSINNGITPTSLVGGNANFPLNLDFVTPLTLGCTGGNVNIPSGTPMTVQLFDPIDNTVIKTINNVTLGSNRLSLKIPTINAPSNSKYLYTVSFVYNGETYTTNLNSNTYLTLESFVNINALLSSPGSTVIRSLANPNITITKTFGSVTKQSNAQLNSSKFTLTSYALPASSNFFFDHNLVESDGTLTDEVTYKICFTNTTNTNILDAELLRDESFIANTDVIEYSISNNCLTMNYKYPDTNSGYFMEPVTFNIYLTEGAAVAPISFGNFKVNGNVMIKNSPDMSIVSKSDQKYQGVYVSGVNKGARSVTLDSVLSSNYFKIPYVDNLTSAFNFEVVPDLLSSTTNYSLVTDSDPLKSPNNFDVIDAFLIPSAPAPHIVYLAKNKTLLFDLTNANIESTDFDGYYFVSATSQNAKERIKFYVNCNDVNYSLICQDKVEYHIKAGFYGDLKMTGNLNSANKSRAFVVINQNPGVLIQGQGDLRDKRYFNYTRSKTIFKYLNQ